MLTVTAGAPRFLIVGLESAGHRIVDHESHVGLVDSHPERVRSDNRTDLLGHERFLNFATPRIIESGVVSSCGNPRALQHRRKMVHSLPRRRVDDRQPVMLAKDFGEPPLLLGVVLHRHHVVSEIWAIEPGDYRLRIPEGQLTADVAANLGRRSRGQRDGRWRAQFLVNLFDTEVTRAEIVTPLTDAVRLVYRQERNAGIAKSLRGSAEVESLGSDVEKLDLPAIHARQPIRNLR